MHIKAFKNFSLGKSGGKTKKDNSARKDAQVAEIADMETKVNNKTKDLQEATEKLNGLRTEAGIEIPIDVIPVRPHGPAAELTLEDEDLSDSSGIKLDEIGSDDSIQIGEDIKIAEVTAAKAAVAKAAPVAAPAKGIPVAAAAVPVEEKKEDKPEEADSLNNLFSQEEEEENPLASLINSLPDVTVRELLEDLEEINRIINEWKPSSK